MILCSLASLSPSVTFARASAVAFLSLHVILAPCAMFLSPAGTIIGGRGLSESGSTYELSWMSLGVPLNAGAGSFMLSGTLSPEELSAAKAECVGIKLATPSPRKKPKVNRAAFLIIFIIGYIV